MNMTKLTEDYRAIEYRLESRKAVLRKEIQEIDKTLSLMEKMATEIERAEIRDAIYREKNK